MGKKDGDFSLLSSILIFLEMEFIICHLPKFNIFLFSSSFFFFFFVFSFFFFFLCVYTSCVLWLCTSALLNEMNYL
jgi:hypothetical protein